MQRETALQDPRNMVPSQAIDGGAPGPGHTGTTCRVKEVTFICKCFASLLGCQGIYFEEKNTKYIISKNFFFFCRVGRAGTDVSQNRETKMSGGDQCCVEQ